MAEIGNVNLQILLVLVVMCCAHGVLGICNVTHCTDGAKCLVSQDNQSCKCTVGYYGDLCDKYATINVTCGKDITIMVMEDFFQYYKVPVESLHLPNASCRAHREVVSNVTYYMSRIKKNMYFSCGGRPLEKNITHISYGLTLISSPPVHGNIIRDPVIKIEYTCLYPYVSTVRLHYPVIPFSSEAVMRVNELEAKVEMLLYKDHTYAEPYRSAPTIHLRDKVYVEVKVTEPVDFFHLRANRCWATQSPRRMGRSHLGWGDDGSHYTLLRNGCVKDETVTFMNTTAALTGSNGDGSTVRFSFDMFRFVVEPHDLYLHCTVHLCTPDDGETCIPECKTITKRAAVRSDPTQSLLSYGPIRIETPERQESNFLVTMVLLVAGIWVLGLFLLIIITIAKAGNRRLAGPHGQIAVPE